MSFERTLFEASVFPPSESTRAILWVPTSRQPTHRGAEYLNDEISSTATSLANTKVQADTINKGYFIDTIRRMPERIEVLAGLVAVTARLFRPLEIEDARAGDYVGAIDSYAAWESLRSSPGTDYTTIARLLAIQEQSVSRP